MSLIIKGINMPKNGEMTIAFASDENGENTLALILDTSGKPIKYTGVAEIPTPHGRLIDADELFCKIDGIKGWDYGDESDMAISAAEALSAIDDSPTIIEAEVSE